MYIYRNGTVRKIKHGMTVSELRNTGYFTRHPGAVVCNKPPTMAALERMADGNCKAIDGCSNVDPDGECQHGMPSWLVALHFI